MRADWDGVIPMTLPSLAAAHALPAAASTHVFPQALEKAALKADKHMARELDVNPKDIDKAVLEAAGEVS